MIDHKLIKKIFEIDVLEFCVSGLGTASSIQDGSILTFLSDEKYLAELNENKSIKVAFVENAIASKLRKDIIVLAVNDPKWFFFTLLNYIAENKNREKTKISATANIHGSAVIYEKGVVIGENVIIEPNVTIYPDTVIEDGVIIRAGAVIGVDGFEHKRTTRGILSVAHDGKVLIKRNAEIGVNSNIVKGFSYRDTIVGEETKIDALVHYAHGVQSGRGCMIVASSMIAGHVTLGENVWIGPNSSIANRLNIGDEAFITFGSVVVKDVAAREKVTGNFAISHNKFIQNLKASIK